MLCFEWWLFEILAILAGLMSVEALAAEVIIVTIVSFMFMIPLGCSFAASAFTGFFCASGKIKEAKKYTRITVLFGEIITLAVLGIIFAFQDKISHFFTRDEKVVEIVNSCFNVLYLYIAVDSVHGTNSGIIRGLGRTTQTAFVTFFCYWLVGLSLAIYLAFKKEQGVQGMWRAFAYACVLYVVCQIIVIEYKPWPDMSVSKEIGPPMTPEDRKFRKVIKDNEIRKGNTPRLSNRAGFGQETTIEVENRLLGDFNVAK